MRGWRISGVMLAVMLAGRVSGTAFGQTITGDLDANHEVSLSDVTGFVGCLTGPDSPSSDPSCVAALFDADDDVDLNDVAGFQNRFGFGVGPPQIDRFWPTPGTWIVDDIGLTQVQVGFSEPVIVPDDAVNVWGVGGGTVTGFSTSYDPDAYLMTVTFATPLHQDRVTVVVDYSLEDLGGNPLDGEIYNPTNAVLPSGNGVNGGQGVFRVHVLQGDANRDGVTDASDLDLINVVLDSCSDNPNYVASADLDNDDCVTEQDLAIAESAIGQHLPLTDGQSPAVIHITVLGSFEASHVISVRFDEPVSSTHLAERTCFLVDFQGNVIVPTSVATPPLPTTGSFVFDATLSSCTGFTINVSNAIADFSGELLSAPALEVCP
jgi:hypothetical protein